MSKVTLTITEQPPGNLVVTIESDPPLPLAGGDLDWQAADSPQTAAVLASRFIGELGSGPTSQITAQDSDEAARKVRQAHGL